MKDVMSVRLDAESRRRLRELARRQKKELSAVARELIDCGWVYLMIQEYRKGKISLGTFAKRLGVQLAEAMDLLAELCVRSPIEMDDYLRSYRAASEFLKGSKT